MSTTDDSVALSAAPRPALIPRLGSLLAFVPLGVWTTWHLWENTYAMHADHGALWQAHVAADRSPFVEFVTALVVLVPLVMHSVWGVRRLFIMRANLTRYPTFDNAKFLLQRLSAIGLLGFLPAHIYLARVEPFLRTHGGHERYELIASAMNHHTPTLVVYVLGVLATAYHLGNGVATGGLSWGYAATPRAIRRMNALSIGFFLVLLAMGWGTIYALYTQGAEFPYVGDESGSQTGNPVEIPVITVPPATER